MFPEFTMRLGFGKQVEGFAFLCYLINSAPEQNRVRRHIEKEWGIRGPVDMVSLDRLLEAKEKEWKKLKRDVYNIGRKY